MATPWFADQLRRRYPDFEFEDISKGRSDLPTGEEWLAALIRSSLPRRTVYLSTRFPVEIPSGASWAPAGGLWKISPGPPNVNLRDPAIYRIRDIEQGQPLFELLSLIAEQVGVPIEVVR